MDASKIRIPLKVLIHKEDERVIFAEGNADFVDILLSFLTLPMGTIFKLLSKHSSSSQPLTIGCFNNLYSSILNLEAKYYATEGCKELLANARKSAEAECQRLKINIDDTPVDYFTCTTKGCRDNCVIACIVKYYEVRCNICSKILKKKAYLSNTGVAGKGVFVNPNELFIISSHLHIYPNNPASALSILKNATSTDSKVREEKTFQIGYSEILDLLKYSIVSETPLTDMFLRKSKITIDKSVQTIYSAESTIGFKKMTVKLWVRKSNKKILLAHCTDEFIDFLFSLLTLPLGRVISVISEDDGLASCLKNMHQSVSRLSDDGYLKSQQMKDMLLYPQVAMLYLCLNQLFPLQEDKIYTIHQKPKSSAGQECYWMTSYSDSVFHELKLASQMGEGGYLKGSTKFMVTDDLVVTPFSSMSCINYVHSRNIPSDDIEEQMVDIGRQEAENLLRASLVSTSVLTDCLKHLI